MVLPSLLRLGAGSLALGRILLAGVTALGLLMLQPDAAYAHANLVSSTPAANAVLERPPATVAIRFTEPVVPRLSKIQVLDQQGRRVDQGDSTVAADDPVLMSVTFPALPNGTYVVAWQNLSTVDGHTVRGSFAFSVGEPLKDSQERMEPPVLQSPIEPVLRWVELWGFMVLAGGLAFRVFVLRPTLPGLPLDLRFRKLLWAALLLGGAAAAIRLLLQAQGAGGLSASTLGSVLGTGFGGLWAARMVLAGMLAVLFIFKMPPWPSLGVSAALLLTLSLSSHAAATAGIRTQAVVTDFAHLLAAAGWAGGLVHLGAAIPAVLAVRDREARRGALAAMAGRFSVLAALCVGVLAVTGAYAAWAQVTAVRALETPYGVVLLAKMGVAAILSAIGAANLLWVRPRLRRGAGGAWFYSLVAVEAVLGTLVLLAVGFLASLEPARQVASREMAAEGKTLRFKESAAGTVVELAIAPARVGTNAVDIWLKDPLGRSIANATSVNVRLAYQGADLGEAPQPAFNAGSGLYRLDAAMPIAGLWQVEVAVQRPDAFDARAAFRFSLGGGAAVSSAAIAPQPRLGWRLFAWEVAALGAVFLAVSAPLGSIFSRAGRRIAAPGAAGLALGLGLLAVPAPAAAPSEASGNPFPPNAASLATGAQLYVQKCQVCHGASGKGDGPGAAGLTPPPLDLTIHARLHPQRDLYTFIQDGVPGTAMPAWGGALRPEQIWHLVNYIQSLGK